MAEALNRESDLANVEHNHAANAKNVIIKGFDGTNYPALKTNADGELVVNLEASTINIGDVDVLSSALPTGAATSAKQLADGHNVAVNNLPSTYALPAAQVSTLTPPAAITGFATSAKQLVDNHQVTVSNPTANPETGLAKTVDITKTLGLSGTLSDTSVTMTSATTAYQLPTSAPASAYTLVIYNTSTTGTIYVRFTTGTTLGIPVAPGGTLSIDLGANVAIFAYSSTAGVVVNCTYGVR